MFVIKRTRDGKYVAKPGRLKSYTTKLEHAERYPTRERAEACMCKGNERVVYFDSVSYGQID